MTAQQPQHAPVRLLIAESSENAAHEFDSLLRDAGIATRAEIIDLPMASKSLGDADMLLANSCLPELEKMLPHLRAKAPNVPIILINPEESNLSTAQGMQLGAADVVPKSEPEQLVLVVKRELEHVCQINRLSQTRRALKEAEQRCQLLLQSSKAAIAYVHEGMHIYANEGYLKLFGFDDAEDLLGLPLMDLLDAESANALKMALKGFRQDEEETVLDFAGQSTKGESVCGNMTLAAAEYEGEQCIQVTVRTGSGSTADPVAEIAETFDDEPIPTLTTDAETSNGAAEAPAGAAPQAARNVGMPEFLAAASATLGEPDGASFRGIFAAEIDAFARLQRDHGLAGGSQICNNVESRLADCLGEYPMTRLSTYQFAFAIKGDSRDSVLAEVDGFRAEV
ncbi:MAG: PAS domain S-box protein, partial [Gammaproteobacteria bacterium]|nr:PAS domain S-box protein [Gammaproteobacteria bacterium]